ncbi:hypothetical protein KZI27_00575 (plasmid) [Curtobacterium sp. TC1]|nr:hypothetical protein KZI27_00575 [Curtobacterium sp. TC1]
MPGDDAEPAVAGVEAASAIEAVTRLRDVVGTHTDVLYIVPDPIIGMPQDATYETFLHDPDTPSPI